MAGSAVPGTAQPGSATPGSPGPLTFSPATPSVAAAPGPSQPFFPAGDQPSAADYYGWWYLNTLFFQRRVVFRARQIATTNTITNDGNAHVIQYDTVDEDPAQGWNAGTFAWTPKLSGWYKIFVTAYTAALSTGSMLRPSIAGTWAYHLGTVEAATSHTAGVEGQFTVYLVGGQSTVSGAAAIPGASVSVQTSSTPGQNSTLAIMWLG